MMLLPNAAKIVSLVKRGHSHKVPEVIALAVI